MKKALLWPSNPKTHNVTDFVCTYIQDTTVQHTSSEWQFKTNRMCMKTSQKDDKNEIVSEGTACQSAVKTKSTSGSDTVNAATGRHISTGITNDSRNTE